METVTAPTKKYRSGGTLILSEGMAIKLNFLLESFPDVSCNNRFLLFASALRW